MKISQAGIDLIKAFEGKRNKAYRCSAGVLTVGYGHTGADVKQYTTWTDEQCEEALKRDLTRFEEGVTLALGNVPVTQNEFDAFVSLSFNIGISAFGRSTVLRRHKEGDKKGAADAFLMWNKVKGAEVAGLTRRRKAERALYLGEHNA